MKKLTWISIIVIALITTSLLAGCSSNSSSNSSKQSTAPTEDTQVEQETIRVFRAPINNELPGEGHPYTEYFKEKLNVDLIFETAPWGGGVEYTQKLQTMIASGDLPDLIRPMNGIEQVLMKQGAALALDDLLPKYAPDLWNHFPKEVWDIVRSTSPDGKIYYIPAVQDLNNRGLIVRKDWLDNLELQPPTTQQEFVEMLRRFKNDDPNGNKESDEIPTIGREQGRWFDHIFAMYGVAMWEGYPEWDVIDGKLQYAGVQPNMKEALAFARDLYKEKLLDTETFLNKTDVWKGKILNDTVGSYYHEIDGSIANIGLATLQEKNPDAKFIAIPIPKVDGVDGFYSLKRFGFVDWVIPTTSESRADSSLKFLNFFYTKEGRDFSLYGLEGDTYTIENGVIKYIEENDTPLKLDDRRLVFSASLSTFDYESRTAEISAKYPDTAEVMIESIDQVMTTSKVIAGDGMPVTVYDGFPDIKGHKLYQQYLTNIVIGEWPIEKFDELVTNWYKTGGEEVTEKANAWYESLGK